MILNIKGDLERQSGARGMSMSVRLVAHALAQQSAPNRYRSMSTVNIVWTRNRVVCEDCNVR